jgi:hypothetical protein
MLWITDWFRKKFSAMLVRLTRRRTAQPPVQQPPPPPQSKPEVIPVSSNRATRRQLERRRRKHDKFVEPKGEVPISLKRAKASPIKRPRIEVVMDDIDDAEIWLHGKHHEDTQEVLYNETELYGEFNFRDTILQQLDRYFVYLARMKRHDAQAYQFYRHYGATILPYVNINAHDRNRKDDPKEKELIPLPEWFHRTRPSFGCFVYGADPETEKYEMTTVVDKTRCLWVPKFLYFTKYKLPPPTIQQISGGDIYSMTVWWDRPFDPKIKQKYGVPQSFGIFISKDGQKIVVLRSLETEYQRIFSKRERGRLYSKHDIGNFVIPKRAWHIPGEFEKWAKHNNEDPQHFLAGLFLDAVQRHQLMQYSMVRVSCTKDDMTATFSVNLHKMGYFFQDRDIHVNQNGIRRRIFHMVRAHTRKDGAVIKFHFRGERRFTWAGYDVLITIPGRDHPIYDDFNLGAEDEYWHDRHSGYIGVEELAKKFAEDIKRSGQP